MKPRSIFPVLFAFASLNLFSQAEIVSITYNGDVAVLTRNTPPAGITYYWQGTSCGTLMNNSGATTLATTDGTQYLRAYYSTALSWATSCASTIVLFPDETPPVLSGVTTGQVAQGDNISATSNEDGMIYLVPSTTTQNLGEILGTQVANAAATANVAVSLSTSGVYLGDYLVYAVDVSDNVSSASALISVMDLTPPVLSGVTAGPIEQGDPIEATSNENGMIYLVPAGTPPDIGSIGPATVASAGATANVAVTLNTLGVGLGDYIVYAVDSYNNVSTASAVITIADLTAPVLFDVSTGPIEIGTDILATSNEDGMIYLVPEGTAANLGDITSAQVAQTAVTADWQATLSTTGISQGNYVVYAVDASENISAASAVISVTAATYIDVRDAGAEQVRLYPANVVDILYIESNIRVSSLSVFSLQGTQVLSVDAPSDQINLSSLPAGAYIVNLTLENHKIYSRKVTKQ